MELVLEVAEHLLGRGVVDAVALPAHGLADVQSREPVAPPPVPVLPAHVGVRDRVGVFGQLLLEHGEQAPLLGHVGMPADVPGHDLLGSHVVYGSRIRLAVGDPELGDVRAQLHPRPVGREVAVQQVLRPRARLVPVRAVFPVRVRPAYPAFQAHAPHDLQHALVAHPHPELVHEAHAYLPVAAPVGRPFPDLCDHGIEVGARLMRRMRQMVEIRGSRQPADLQQVVEPVPLPCEQSDDGASLALRDFCARRARSFSRYATFAFR